MINKIYNNLNKKDISKWTTEAWEKAGNELEEELLPFPNEDFLNLDTIRGHMFVVHGKFWMWQQLRYLKKTLPFKFLEVILKEDKFGNPEIKNKEFQTSHNSIHILYHLVKYCEQTNTTSVFDRDIDIIEWGGGYGCMAKLVWRFNNGFPTYTIVDLPLLSCLQYYYLSEIFGKDKINLIKSKEDEIQKNKINLLPVSFVEDFDLKADMFISTWALNESSKYSQDFVRKNNYFGAEDILLAYSKDSEAFPKMVKIEEDLLEQGATLTKINYLPRRAESFYLFK